MNPWRWIGVGVGVLGCVIGPSRVEAGPTLWERVKRPELRHARELYRRADAHRVPREDRFDGERSEQLLNQQSAIVLSLGGAEGIPDPSLAFLLGDCLAKAPAGVGQARGALERALSLWPDHPLAAAAWYDLALAAEVEEDFEAASSAYDNALRLQWDAEVRADLYRARAQLRMGRGDLKAAIADFRVAVGVARNAELRAISQWGLAVALDRSHDFPAAVPLVLEAQRARFGGAGRSSVIDVQTGALWPLHELHYYRALGLRAEAVVRRGQSGHASALFAAQLAWQQYVEEAPEDDPWLPRVREHRAAIRAELDQIGDPDDDGPG